MILSKRIPCILGAGDRNIRLTCAVFKHMIAVLIAFSGYSQFYVLKILVNYCKITVNIRIKSITICIEGD